uniref:GGDEF domain-containing protein n=1 Tax=Ascaris lumbricoides TaxID=6252 RepID=A0A0M3IHU3_ASCLU
MSNLYVILTAPTDAFGMRSAAILFVFATAVCLHCLEFLYFEVSALLG